MCAATDPDERRGGLGKRFFSAPAGHPSERRLIYAAAGACQCKKCAALELAELADLPDEFILFLFIKEQNARFHCRIVWQNGNRIGVQYP
jgi:hypothetical protein